MTLTDLIAISICLWIAIQGFFKGFLASLLGPMALIFSSMIVFAYYVFTRNIMACLIIGLIAPIVLTLVFKFCLFSWNKVTNPQPSLSMLSRISGAVLNLGWGMIMMVIMVLLLAVIPPINKPLVTVYKDVHLSVIYKMIKPLDSFAVDKPGPRESLEDLSKDKRIQAIINDPEIIKAVQSKNYSTLMNNPKILAIAQDPQMLKRMLAIYKKIQEQEK